MEPGQIIMYVGIAFVVMIFFSCFVTVQQGTIAVITTFGKYRRVMGPGLNFKLPIIEQIYRRVPGQNRSLELEFQAITIDQANVYFKAMLLYSVLNNDERTIQNVAFKFVDDRNFMDRKSTRLNSSHRT